MQINFQNINTKIAKTSIAPVKTMFSGTGKVCGDAFVKQCTQTGFKGVEETAFSEEKLRQIYDSVYDKVIAQNPIAEALNIKKPALVINNDPDYNDHSTYKFNFRQIS